MTPPCTAACRSPDRSLCQRRPDDSRPAQERRNGAWGRRPLRGDLAIKNEGPGHQERKAEPPPAGFGVVREVVAASVDMVPEPELDAVGRVRRTCDEQRSGGFSASQNNHGDHRPTQRRNERTVRRLAQTGDKQTGVQDNHERVVPEAVLAPSAGPCPAQVALGDDELGQSLEGNRGDQHSV